MGIGSKSSLALLAVVGVSACSFDLSVPDGTARGGVTGTVDTQGHAARGGITVKLTEVHGSKATQETDADGKFTFGDLAPGSYFLEIQREGFAPFSLPAVQVPKGPAVDVGVLTLLFLQGTPAEATVTGKVVTQGGGVPESARVDFVLQGPMQRVATTVADSSGLFTQRVPPGRYVLRASHPLYVTAERRDVVVAEGAQVDLTADPLSLALNPATLTGRVLVEVDGSNAGAPKAQVQVTLDSGQTTTTDVDGRFMLAGLAGGARLVRFAVAGYVDPAQSHPVTLVPGQTAALGDVTLTLRRGAIRGTVQLSDRQPVQDVTVAVSGTPYAALATPDATQPGVGTFRISGVPLGTYEVSATKARYARAVATAVQLTEAAPIADVGTLTLTLLQGEFRIDDGDPLSSPGFTRTRGVTLDLSQFTGATDFRAAEDPQFADGGTPWVAFSGTSQPFTLSAPQGTHTVYAQYRTSQGTSPTFSSTVVLDTSAPTSASVVLNGGEGFTRSAQTLAVRLTADDPTALGVDRVSGLARMRVSLTGPTATADGGTALLQAPVDYQRDHAFSLPQPQTDGPLTLWAQVLDAAGNASPVVSADIVLDRVEPQNPQLAIRDGAAATAPGFTNVGQVIVDHSANAEPHGGVLFVKLANSATALASAVYQPFTPATVHALDPLGAELKTVHARLRDSAGNETPPLTANITYDVTPPGPVSVTVLSANPTNDAGVTLSLAATDTNGLSPTRAVAVSEDPLFGRAVLGPSAMPASGQLVFTLSPGDGTKQVLVRYTDKAGNVASASAAVTLDTTPPAGSFVVTGTLADGTFSTQDTANAQVRVAVSAPDATQVLFGDESLTACPTAGWQALQPSMSFTLTGATTPRTVRACVRDATGNTALLPEQRIRLDTTAPAGCTLTLTGKRANDAAAPPTGKTAKELVTAAVACSGEAPTELVLANGSVTCSATAQLDWRAFTPATAFLLAGPDGANAVNGCVRDAARNVAAVSGATITLDTTPPQGAGLLLDPTSGVSAAYVNQAQITARGGTKANAQGQAAGAVEWMLSQAADFTGGSWSAFPGTSPQLFTFAGTGAQPLFAQFRDDVGNVSPTASASITFDGTAPANGSLAITTPSGGSVTNSVSVVVTVGAPADAVSMQLAEASGACSSATFSGVTPRPVTGSVTFVLSAGDGAKTVCAQFTDAAGNVSAAPASATVTLDTAPPTVAVDLVVASVTNPPATRVPGVSVVLTAAGATQYALSSSPQECGALPTTAWQTLGAGPYGFTLPGSGAPPAVQTVFACVRDGAGNTASAARSILFDTVAPTGSFTVGSGQSVQSGATFTVNFRDVPSDVTQMALAVDAAPTCSSAAYVTFSATPTQALSDGSRSVYACVRDAAGNSALLGPVAVTVDNAQPTLGTVTLSGLSNAGANVTRDYKVTVNLASIADSASGVDSLRVGADPAFAGAAWQAVTPVAGAASTDFTLPPGDGPKTVYVQVRDRAGLSSSAISASTTLDTTPPQWTQAPAPIQLYVSGATASITAAATDTFDAQAQLSVALASTATGCASASYVAYTGTQVFSGLAAGWNTIFACVRDRAGNVPLVPPWTEVNRVAAPPAAAQVTANAPVPLASGALLSWSDGNVGTARLDIEASLDPTFATGVRTYTTASGTCTRAGVSPPPSSARVGLQPGDLPLTNLRSWYFRLFPVDCAGQRSTSAVAVPGAAVPNLGPTPVGAELNDAHLDVVGSDLWLHAAENLPLSSTRAERLRHCRTGVVDCRNSANWATLRVTLYGGGPVLPADRPAQLFATDDTLYLVDTIDPNGANSPIVAMSYCDRSNDCDDAINWVTGNVLRAAPASAAISVPVAAANSSALVVAYVLRQPGYGMQPFLSLTRCDRGRGTGCRTTSSWAQVDSALKVSPTVPMTIAAQDSVFLIGGVSTEAYGYTVTAAGQPMMIRCEGVCDSGGTPNAAACNGGNGWPPPSTPPACGCDGELCGSLRFSRLAAAGGGEQLVATAPGLAISGNYPTLAWLERRCPAAGACSERVASATCLSTDCPLGTNFATSTVATWTAAPTVSVASPLGMVRLSSSNTQENQADVRVTYTDTQTHYGWLASCATSPGTLCFATHAKTQLTFEDRTLSPALAAVGRDVYALGTASTGETILWQPIVPAPTRFVLGPKVGALEASWAPFAASTSTALRHGPLDGGATTTVTIEDAFATSLSVNTTTGRTGALSFSNGNGAGDPGLRWASSPFKAARGAGGDLSGVRGLSVAAPGPSVAPLAQNGYVYAVHTSASRGLALGRCDTAGDCGVDANWTWSTIDTGGGIPFDWVQVAVDYPREFAHLFGNFGRPSHGTPRLFVSAVWSGQLILESCLLTTPTACALPGDFTRSRIDGAALPLLAPGAQPTLRATGDYVQVTEAGAAAGQIVVRFCDGSATYPHDVYASALGAGTTNRALNYCFSAANWRAVTLSGSLYGATLALGQQAAGAPHSVYGYLALQQRQGDGFVFWSCAYGAGGSPTAQRDCSVAANWKAVAVPTGGPAEGLDLTATDGSPYYAPTRSITGPNSGVYATYFDSLNGRWGMAQCKGDARPDFLGWGCEVENGPAHTGRQWSTSSVLSGVFGSAAGSTLRVVNGDLLALFGMTDRTFVGRCSGAFDCLKRSSWNAYSVGSYAQSAHGAGLLASGISGDIILGYGAADATATLLSGGRFASQ